jgi:pyridoxamine 5'-phosphate oxidase
MSIFDAPPAGPMSTVVAWFDEAKATGAREPGVLALATASTAGQVSNRIVQTIRLTEDGLVFTSHGGSQKGRDIAATGRSSGVLYWRESGRQVILSGPTAPLPAEESDRLWYARPVSTHPMSVAAVQSVPLDDEEKLRAEALRLAEPGEALPRPDQWLGYLLAPDTVEFWEAAPDRLHRRLRYDRTDDAWTWTRLQP